MAAKVALLALVIFFPVAASPAYDKPRGFHAAMTRRDPSINFTLAAHKSHERLSLLAARFDATTGGSVGPQAPLRLDAGGAAYDMTFSIGTPPQKLLALADTGSDLIWTKCGVCLQCSPQGTPSYYPDSSSSFSKLPCSEPLCAALTSESVAACGASGAECFYRYSYGLAANPHHYTQGYLGKETLTLGGDAVPGIGFGCTTMSEGGYGTGGSGLVGLSRGPLSLVTQLNVGAFSYCLATKASKSSPLLFGALAVLSGAGVQATPLLPSSSFYVVDLKTISIGSETTTGAGTAGVIFDSGTAVAFLAEPAYTAALKVVLSQTKLPRTSAIAGYEACFLKQREDGSDDDSWKTSIPSMALHFDGGADMALPLENYFGQVRRGVAADWDDDLWGILECRCFIINSVMLIEMLLRIDSNINKVPRRLNVYLMEDGSFY